MSNEQGISCCQVYISMEIHTGCPKSPREKVFRITPPLIELNQLIFFSVDR